MVRRSDGGIGSHATEDPRMTLTKTICRRCHRLRPVNGVRYCASCEQDLRAQERPRRPPPAAAEQDATDAAAAASTTPPPPEPDTLPELPAVEGPAPSPGGHGGEPGAQ